MEDKQETKVVLTYGQAMVRMLQLSGLKWSQALMDVGLFASSALVGLLPPLCLRWLVDGMGTSPMHSSRPAVALGIMSAALLVSWALGRIGHLYDATVQRDGMQCVYEAGFAFTLRKSTTFFQDEFIGRIVKRVSRLPKALENCMDMTLRLIPATVTTCLGSLAIMIWRMPLVGCLLVLTYGLGAAYVVWARSYKMSLDRAKTEAESDLSGMLADTVSNQQAARLFDGYGYEQKRFGVSAKDLSAKTFATWRYGIWTFGVQTMFAHILTVVALGSCLWLWRHGRATAGDMLLVFGYMSGLSAQLVQIREITRTLYEALEDAHDALLVVDHPSVIADHPQAADLLVMGGTIEFKDVTFGYAVERVLLKAFNLKVEGGKKVALCGPSGAGKTTAFNLLLRLHEVLAGSIVIDGQPISHVTQASLRQAMVLVPQEALLFHRSLLENIRYARPEASDEEVKEAARRARCEEFILATKDGYGTLVGERGVKLSGGERQRMAIARAFLSRAPIVLLDEPTSQLDSETEALIQAALHELMQGRTVLVIAHRLSTIREMDEIIVLSHGAMVDRGTHKELISRNGLYADLWRRQAGDYHAPTTASVLN